MQTLKTTAFILIAVALFTTGLSLPVRANEYSGLLVKDVDGALPKGLWIGSRRSDVVRLFRTMPATAPLRSMQVIKRNMLLTNYAARGIIEDTPREPGDDLFTLRLIKLMQMGMWDDAYDLYSSQPDLEINNEQRAQISVLLTLYRKNIPTACLLGKSYETRYDSSFWTRLAFICNREIGSENDGATMLDTDNFVARLYTNTDLILSAATLPATDVQLDSLDFLDVMIAYKKGRLRSDLATLDNLPPYLLTLLDNLEGSSVSPVLMRKLYMQGIEQAEMLPYASAAQPLENYEGALRGDIYRSVIFYLYSDQSMPESIYRNMAAASAESSRDAFYLALIHRLENHDNPFINNENSTEEEILSSFPTGLHKKVQILKRWLDIAVNNFDNPATVYEKQGAESDYPAALAQAVKDGAPGTALLLVLNSNENRGPGSENVLSDLRRAGLIEQARLIARDLTAQLIETAEL